MKILDDVIKKHTYSAKEKSDIRKKIDSILEKIDEECKRRKISARCVLGGSAAKGTLVRGDFDCDVFVRFDARYQGQDISDILAPVLRIFKGVKRLHGSRDYFQFEEGGMIFEIVPVMTVDDVLKAKNVTDISPLHVAWVKQNISDLCDEIILTKLFCRSIGVYGAESYIKGFSGHVIDILTIHYGGFIPLLKASLKWKGQPVIDVKGYYKSRLEALMSLNRSKTQSAMVVIDPIQKTRNASAVLSEEKMQKFIKSAKEFLANPNPGFFERKVVTPDQICSKVTKGLRLVFLEVVPKEGKKDIVGGKLLKSFTYIKNKILDAEFRLADSGWSWDGVAHMWFLVADEVLGKTQARRGPPVDITSSVRDFERKHKSYYVKGRYVYADVPRDYTRIDDLLQAAINDRYVKDKVMKISRIEK